MSTTSMTRPVSTPERCLGETISVNPLTVNIGAEIVGVDLSRIDDATVAAIRAALLEHKVVFFREQRLGSEDQIAFAQRLGALTAGHPTIPSPDEQRFILELDSLSGGRADYWHTDVTFTVEPPSVSVLRAVELPLWGGDTQWASTEAAYDRLPGPLRRLADELHAIHTNTYDYGRPATLGADELGREHWELFTSTAFETEHPVVALHPETGRPALLLGGFARRITGLPEHVSRDLLRIFASYVTRPEHIVRWRWQPGDVAMWDNRSTQHYAVNDYADSHRVMQRVTLAGTAPIGLDGWRSQSRKGDSSAYQAGLGR